MIIILFCFISIIFLSFIFLRKKIFFGFKESFACALIFYIHIPLFIFYFYQDFLINNFPNFNVYKIQEILKIQYLSIIAIISFVLGYISLNKKIHILNLKANFNYSQIFIAFLILFASFFISIPNINTVMLMFILVNLIVFKSNKSNSKKILYTIFLTLLFMYLSVHFSSARRHVIIIFFISLFFLSFLLKSKKSSYFVFSLLFFVGICFVFYVTYLRSLVFTPDLNSASIIGLGALIANYDFMSAFDNLVYIVGNSDFLYGKSLFKIFISFIPREIWPSKPLDTNLLIVGIRQNAFVGGSSQSVTLLGEVYWNFGWIGTIISFFLIGVFAKNFDLIKNDKLPDTQVIILSSLVYLIFIMWRGSISTSLVIYFCNIFFLLFILILVKTILNWIKDHQI